MALQYICSNCGAEMNLSDGDIHTLEQTRGLFQKRLQCAVCRAFIAIPDAHLPIRSEKSGYRIGARIEVDGSREIYLAEHIQKHQQVEVQVFHSSLLENGEPARLFLDAMSHYMKIRHPNLISIKDAGQFSGGTYFAAWQRDSSISLEQRLWNGGALDLKHAIQLAAVIGRVQEWLWTQHGLIYGVLTPRRVWIAPNNNVWLSNTILTPLLKGKPPTFPMDTLGMPGFMSPEILAGSNSLDCRSDIYALGATLYSMLTGKAPFRGLNAQQIQELQTSASLPDPRTLNPDLPSAVVEFLKSTLAHDPNDRPQDWPTWLDRLAELNNDKPIATPVAPMKHHSVLIQLNQAEIPPPPKKMVFVRQPPPAPIATISAPVSAHSSSRAFFGVLAGGIAIATVLIVWLALTAQPDSSPLPHKSESNASTNAGSQAGAIAATAPQSHTSSNSAPQIHRPSGTSFEALYKATQEHLKTNPTDYDALLDQYNVLVAMTETVKPTWHFQILEERRGVEMLKAFALNRAIDEIRQKATDYSNIASYNEGIAWLAGYHGAFSNETSELRGHLSSNLFLLAQSKAETVRAKQQLTLAEQNEKQTAQRKIFLTTLAKTVMENNFDQAGKIIANLNHPQDMGISKAQQDELLVQLDLLCKLPDIVMDHYRALIGKSIKLELTTETMTGKLTGVENQRITIQTLSADGGLITLPVSFDKIRPQDVMQRLAGMPPAERLLMQGFYAWQQNDGKTALASFSGMTNSLLALALANHIEQLLSQSHETEAQNDLNAMLALAGIAPGVTDDSQIATQIDQIAFTDAQCLKIKEAAQHFTKLYGNTATARKAASILAAANAASSITRKTDLATLKNMIEPWKSWNAGGKPLLFSYRIDGDLIYLDLSENKSLPNLSAFKSFPIKELSLRKCGITKLPSLEGFHINRLDLSESEITNLSGIRDAFIDELILSSTQVTNLRPLKSLSLHVFIAENCPTLSDLSGLATTNLTRIVLTGSGVSDLSPLAGAPLISADFSKCTLINDLGALAQCPLEELILAGCSRITMIYALKGIPLRKLNISGTTVSDLTPLSYMPLETLDLSNGKNISDLSPLVGNTHLQNLTLPSKSANAACLRQHKTLETIGFPTPISAELFWKRN